LDEREGKMAKLGFFCFVRVKESFEREGSDR
jgi:hypothetical protein